MFIPGIILPVISAYYPKIRIEKKFILVEMISALAMSTTWLFIRESFSSVKIINEIEPMLVGLILAFIIHFVRLLLLWK